MGAVLFDRPDRDDDSMMLLQPGLEFEVGELSEKDSRWFHTLYFTLVFTEEG
jgi:hypothetical protein